MLSFQLCLTSTHFLCYQIKKTACKLLLAAISIFTPCRQPLSRGRYCRGKRCLVSSLPISGRLTDLPKSYLPRPTTGSLVSLILAWSLMGILTLVGGGLGMGMTVGGSSPASHFPSLTTVCLRLMCFTPRTQFFIHRTGELWCFSSW